MKTAKQITDDIEIRHIVDGVHFFHRDVTKAIKQAQIDALEWAAEIASETKGWPRGISLNDHVADLIRAKIKELKEASND